MRTAPEGTSRFHEFTRRVLEGRVSPLQFLIIVGAFATLLLLYISLHVCFFTLSTELEAANVHRDALTESNARLIERYNELAAPARIIPLARDLGMRAGAHDEVERFALDEEALRGGEPSWAQASLEKLLEWTPGPDARGAK